MRNSSFGSKEKSGWKIGGETTTVSVRAGNGGAQETDPLIRRGSTTASSTNHQSSNRRPSSSTDNSNLRERRPSRSSPITVSLLNQRFGGPSGEEQNKNKNYQPTTMDATSAASANANSSNNDEPTSSYTQLNEDASRTGNASVGGNSAGSYQNSTGGGSRSVHSLRRSHLLSGRDETAGEGTGNASPLLEIPEEIYRVRRAALQVLKPLTRTWVSNNILFSSFPCTPFVPWFAHKFLLTSLVSLLSCYAASASSTTPLYEQLYDHKLPVT